MFGFLRKRNALQPAADTAKADGRAPLAQLISGYEAFSTDITETYRNIDHNPAELRFFAMAATSVFVQLYGELAESRMQAIVGDFYEQASANLLLHMPRADYSLVYAAAVQRFPEYADPIRAVMAATDTAAMQDANFVLMNVLDENLRVEREAFDRTLAALEISASLVGYAVQVKQAIDRGRQPA